MVRSRRRVAGTGPSWPCSPAERRRCRAPVGLRRQGRRQLIVPADPRGRRLDRRARTGLSRICQVAGLVRRVGPRRIRPRDGDHRHGRAHARGPLRRARRRGLPEASRRASGSRSPPPAGGRSRPARAPASLPAPAAGRVPRRPSRRGDAGGARPGRRLPDPGAGASDRRSARRSTPSRREGNDGHAARPRSGRSSPRPRPARRRPSGRSTAKRKRSGGRARRRSGRRRCGPAWGQHAIGPVREGGELRSDSLARRASPS